MANKPFIWSKLIIVLLGFISLYSIFNVNKWKHHDVLVWDIAGYYAYLPATLIYHDLAHLSFYPMVDSAYRPSRDVKWHGIYEIAATGKKLDKYPMGVALFELPFFLCAHAYTLWWGGYPADGYSIPYRISVCLATVFWVLLGLVLLRRLLLRYYSEAVVFITILLIAFGTNLFNYTAFDWGMSHAFSFFLFAAFLYCTDKRYRTKSKSSLLWMGALLGWIVITRPTNIIIVLVPLLWPAEGCSSLKDKARLLKENLPALVLSFILFSAFVLLQAAYWRYITGDWLYYSYQKEGFNFLSPQIIDGLLSYRKGWFVYTPMAMVALAGFVCLYKSNRQLVLPLLSFVVVNVYIVFSWYQWHYGGSFGARALLESFVILSLPLAAFVKWLLQLKIKALQFAIVLVLSLMVLLNVFQTWQFSHGLIIPDGMNREYYWKHFFDTGSGK